MDIATDPSRPHPFAHDVDPEAFYRSPLHESARAALVADAKTHTGFLILSGEPGTGKTAVLERVARDLEQAGVRVLRASALRPPHEMFPPADGAPASPGTSAPTTWGASFLTTLRARVRSEGATVVAVDDAQRLTLSELRFFRDLADAEQTSRRRLAILLVSQPSFDVKFARLEDDRADAAFVRRVRLAPLDTSDVRAYIAYRLARVGFRLDDVFEADAVGRVAAYAQGLPRMINQLCYAALHTATEAGLTVVSASSVETAASWLELDLPRPAELTDERRMGTWAREVGSEGAVLGAWIGRVGPALAAASRGVRTGARGVVSAGALLWARMTPVAATGMASVATVVERGVKTSARGITSAAVTLRVGARDVGAALAASGRAAGRAGRSGARGVAAAAAILWIAARGVAVAMGAAGHAVGRGARVGVLGIASAGAMLWTRVRGVGVAVMGVGHAMEHGLRTGVRGVAATLAMLWAGARGVGAAVVAGGHAVGRGVRTGARGIAAAAAMLWIATRGFAAAMGAAGHAVGRGARVGVLMIASAGTMLWTRVRGVGAAAVASGHAVGRAARTGVRGVVSAGAMAKATASNVGVILITTAGGAWRGIGKGAHGVATSGSMLRAWAQDTGVVLAAARQSVGQGVRAGGRGVVSAGTALGAWAWRAAASVAPARRAASRRTEAWVAQSAASIPPKIRVWSPGAVLAVLGLVVVTLVLALLPVSYAPPPLERPPPSALLQSPARPPEAERPPVAERKPPARAVARGGPHPRGTSGAPASVAREPVTFATPRPPSDR